MHSKEQVNDYINGQLKNLFGIKLKERNFQNNKGNYHSEYCVEEENEKVTHLIYVNEYSSIANYYNIPTIKVLKSIYRRKDRKGNFKNEKNEKINEIGKTQINNFYQLRYSYYTTEKDLIIKFELSGERVQLKTKMEKGDEFYTYLFVSEKPYEEDIIAQ